jgi:hypothetical protein
MKQTCRKCHEALRPRWNYCPTCGMTTGKKSRGAARAVYELRMNALVKNIGKKRLRELAQSTVKDAMAELKLSRAVLFDVYQRAGVEWAFDWHHRNTERNAEIFERRERGETFADIARSIDSGYANVRESYIRTYHRVLRRYQGCLHWYRGQVDQPCEDCVRWGKEQVIMRKAIHAGGDLFAVIGLPKECGDLL